MTATKPHIHRKRPGMWVFISDSRRATFPTWSAALAYAGRQMRKNP